MKPAAVDTSAVALWLPASNCAQSKFRGRQDFTPNSAQDVYGPASNRGSAEVSAASAIGQGSGRASIVERLRIVTKKALLRYSLTFVLRRSLCSSRRIRLDSSSQSILRFSHASTPAAHKRIMRPFCRCTMRRASATSSSAWRRSSSIPSRLTQQRSKIAAPGRQRSGEDGRRAGGAARPLPRLLDGA